MPTHEILREQWGEFFQTFTSDHQGWLVDVGIKGRHAHQKPSGPEVRELPLREISADLKDRESTIVITVGLSGHDFMRHAIETVSRISLIQTNYGTDSALQIESLDGMTTTVKLRPIVLSNLAQPDLY